MKTTKTMKKTMRTQNILMINHLLDVTDWKYLRSSPWAASTFSSVVSTLASILQLKKKDGIIQNQLTKIHLALVYKDHSRQELANDEFSLAEILSPAEISTEHKYLRLILTLYSPKGPAGFINESGKGLKQSRTQSPQALWPAVGRLERLWGIRKKKMIGCTVKACIVFTQKSRGNKIPAPQNLSRRMTTGQRA